MVMCKSPVLSLYCPLGSHSKVDLALSRSGVVHGDGYIDSARELRVPASNRLAPRCANWAFFYWQSPAEIAQESRNPFNCLEAIDLHQQKALLNSGSGYH